jgi:hypothetical protein
VLYVCAPAALSTVTRARATLGSAAARIEVRSLPPDAMLASPASSSATSARATRRASTASQTTASQTTASRIVRDRAAT